MTARTAVRVAAILLVVTAGLFALGVSQERGDGHAESTETPGEAAHPGESGERAEQHAAETQREASSSTERHTILGVDPEAPGLVAVAVVLSFALAAGLWFTNQRGLAPTAATFAVLFAVLDVAEVTHQLDEERNGLAAIAIAIAIGHAAAALTAGRAALRPDPIQEVA